MFTYRIVRWGHPAEARSLPWHWASGPGWGARACVTAPWPGTWLGPIGCGPARHHWRISPCLLLWLRWRRRAPPPDLHGEERASSKQDLAVAAPSAWAREGEEWFTPPEDEDEDSEKHMVMNGTMALERCLEAGLMGLPSRLPTGWSHLPITTLLSPLQ